MCRSTALKWYLSLADKRLGRSNENEQKLNAFSCELDLEAINSYLNSWELICKGAISGGAIAQFEVSDRFRWLAASRSTIIQSSKTHSGLTENPENELQTIFERHVLES